MGNDLQTVLLLYSAFPCIFRFFGLSPLDTVTTLMLSHLASFLPFPEVIPAFFCNFVENNEMKTDYSGILSRHGVRPTAVRILVYKTMQGFYDTFSMGDLEMALVSVDKSTIFRTLCLFAEKHIVHEIEDGSSSTKYCLCHNDHVCGVEELHCHFYCESCNKTFCLVHTHIPIVRYPEGFELRQISYLLKGLCADCRKKRHN